MIVAVMAISVLFSARQDARDIVSVHAANALVGCLTGAIGSAYNGSSVADGCSLGATGGLLSSAAKTMMTASESHAWMAAAGHIVSDIGGSVSAAAFEGHGVEKLTFTFGPVGIDVSGSTDIQLSLLPAIGMARLWAAGGHIAWARTINSLTPVYEMPAGDTPEGKESIGISLGNVVGFSRDRMQDDSVTIAHELIHTVQYAQFSPARTIGAWHIQVGQDVLFYGAYNVASVAGYKSNVFEIEANALE